MIDKLDDIFAGFGYRIGSVETDFSITNPLTYHINAEGIRGTPTTDTSQIMNELSKNGFGCIKMVYRREVDTYNTYTIGSRVPEVIEGMIHHILEASITPHKYTESITPQTYAATNIIPQDDTFSLSGAL